LHKEFFSTHELWLVQFYRSHNCDQCKRFVNEYLAVADNLHEIVNVAAIDCDENEDLCGVFKLTTLPMICLFPSEIQPIPERPQHFVKNPLVYQGAGSASSIKHWVISLIPDEVKSVDEGNIDDFLSVEMPKVILFSEKSKPANLYKSLSLSFKNVLSFGLIKSSESNLVDYYKIQNFPTIIMISNSGDVIKYEGKIERKPIIEFLSPFAANYYKQQQQQQQSEEPKEKYEEITPELHYIQNQEDFDENCRSTGLCYIVFLDPSNEENEKYITLLEAMVTKHPKFSIMWVDGPTHLNFAKGFSLPDGFPQAVLLQKKHLKYRVFTGAFEEELIDEFFDMAVSGKGRTATLSKLPSFEEKKEDL